MKPLTIRTVTLNCLFCGPMPFNPMNGESDEDALQRHYAAPIHHHNHMHYMGEPCFCGIDSMIEPLFSESYRKRVAQPK